VSVFDIFPSHPSRGLFIWYLPVALVHVSEMGFIPKKIILVSVLEHKYKYNRLAFIKKPQRFGD
jgi:hypothetical protein